MNDEPGTIYFYKVQNPYGCFSNFSRHGIHLHGEDWLTVEHYYQAQKFVNTVNAELVTVVKLVPTPTEAAQLGRDPRYQVRSDWEVVKLEIMREAVLTKFLSHLEIQKILLSTGERVIVEDSPTDYFWGCGIDRTGENHLGKILMSVRQQIRESRE